MRENYNPANLVNGEDLVVSKHISTMALSGNTLVHLSDGTKKLLRDIAKGDEILNNKGEPTTIIDNLS